MESLLVNLIPVSPVTVEGTTEMAGAATTAKSGQVKKTLFCLKDQHHAHICDYLETDDHFAEIYGSGRKLKIAGRNQSKATAIWSPGYEEDEDDEEDGLNEVVDGGSTGMEEVADHHQVDKNSQSDTIDVSSHIVESVEGHEVLPPQQAASKALGNGKPTQKPKELCQGRGSMAMLFQATIKQKAEYRTAALQAKDRFVVCIGLGA
ncbi:hypothetical protein R1sor_002967 [Riccia sorocarpa]|uniref:Uncharacterized protein n=1 Tax=Riccia sorocarpa TaxID=122646 RepID=A0ABD3H081_9MARC